MSKTENIDLPFLSIVVPCYNSETTLNRLFVSLKEIKQNFVEVIFVDNGSKDNTSELLAKFCSDSYLRNFQHIYFDEMSGPGVARMQGFELARGEYILFVDSDDEIESKNLSKLIEDIVAEDARKDVYFCNATINKGGNEKSLIDDLKYLKTSKTEILNSFLLHKVDPTVMFNLFRRQFLKKNKIQFRSGLHEDVDFSFEVLAKMESWEIKNDIIYHKIDQENSIINTFSPAHLKGYSYSLKCIKSHIDTLNLNIQLSVLTDFATQILGSRISRYFGNQSNYGIEDFFSDLWEEIYRIDKFIPIQERLSKCILASEKKRWSRLLALFFQNYEILTHLELEKELKSNLYKYWSCYDLKHSVFFAPDEIRTCCKRYHYNGEMKGDATLYDENDFIPEHLEIGNIIEAKKSLNWEINNGTDNQCTGCPHLKFDDWKTPLDTGIKYLSLEYHSLCNMRCNYCSEKYFGGRKPKYDIVQTISSCITSQKLSEPDYIVWGGGEPTFEKISIYYFLCWVLYLQRGSELLQTPQYLKNLFVML